MSPPPAPEPAPFAGHAPPGFLLWVTELVRVHRARLLGYARRRGLPSDEALDAVQDAFAAFLTLPQARSIAREGDDAVKLLTVILRHEIMNRVRKRTRRARGLSLLEPLDAIDDDEPIDALVERAEEIARMKGCIARMARLQRAVILLALVEERPREEIGAVLGISSGHVRVLLHRARDHVRNCPFDEPAV